MLKAKRNKGLFRRRSPVYKKMQQDIIDQIETSALSTGDYLLPERTLSCKYGISYISVRKGLEELARNGFIEKQAGKGSRIIPRNLRADKIALVTVSMEQSYLQNIVRGIGEGLKGSKLLLQYFDSRWKEENEVSALNYISEDHFVGVIVYSFATPRCYTALAALQNKHMPIVLLDRCVPGLNVSVIGSDNIAGGRLITQHLFDQGYKRIAAVFGDVDVSAVKDRLQGYRQVKLERGDGRGAELECLENGYSEKGENETKQWIIAQVRKLMAGSGKADAIFFENDLHALYGIEELRNMRIEIPGQVGVAGFDDLAFSGSISPALTTVRQNGIEIGRKTAERLVKSIKTGETIAHAIEEKVPLELVIRESTSRT